MTVDRDDVVSARERIRGLVEITPLIASSHSFSSTSRKL